jgi:hypothetical protein
MVMARRHVHRGASKLMLVIFTEEESMKVTIKEILDKLGISDTLIIAHQGVSDLERSLPKKLRAWRDPSAKFLIIRDNDDGNCRERKAKILKIAEEAGRLAQTKVRIVCQELEAWFVGDVSALDASNYLDKQVPSKLKVCDPDTLSKPSIELNKLKRGYGKVTGAARIAAKMSVDENRSQSFLSTVNAIRELAN